MLNRETGIIAGLDLNSTTSRVRVLVASGSAVAVYARPEFGTWGTATLSIKHASTSDSPAADFTDAKTIPAGGGVASMSASEMLAVRELDITVPTPEGAAATATLRIVGDVLGISRSASGSPGFASIPGGLPIAVSSGTASDSPSGSTP